MSYTLVQSNYGGTNVASPAATAFNSNNTAGNCLMVVARASAFASGLTVKDSQSNTWHIAQNISFSGNGLVLAYALNCEAGANTVTVTGGTLLSVVIAEYSGVVSFDTSAATSALTSTVVNSGNITTQFTGELLIGGIYPFAIFTPDAGWTAEVGAGAAFVPTLMDQNPAGAAGTYAASGTQASATAWAAGIMAFIGTQTIAPTFSPVNGIYALPLTITITSASPSATIFYTTDGTTPTHSSSSISSGGTISISSASIVKAFATSSGLIDSVVSAGQFGTPFNAWTPLGQVIPNTGGNIFNQPNVLYEGNPIILTGHTTVFKMWCDVPTVGTQGIYYFESLTGLPGSWQAYSGNPIIPAAATLLPKLFKYQSTYYLYVGFSNIDVYTSTDGITFTQQATALMPSASGWDNHALYQLGVCDVVGGVWYGYYGALATPPASTDNYVGLATSTDGIHWTKNPSNPVILFSSGNWVFTKIGSVYYGFSQGLYNNSAIPNFTAIFTITSTSAAGPWTEVSNGVNPIPTYYSSSLADFSEGANPQTTHMQVGDPSIVFDGTNSWFFYSATVDGGAIGINAAVAYNTTLAQLAATYIGVIGVPISADPSINETTLASDAGTGSNANPIGGAWTTMATTGIYGPAQRISNVIEAASLSNPAAIAYNNTISWAQDQWAQITASVCSGGSIIGVSLRQSISGAATCYNLFWTGTLGSPGTWTIQRVINGTATSLITGTGITLNVGDTLMGVINGPNLYIYWNGILVGTTVDTNIVSGAAGFILFAVTSVANAAIGAWSGGNFRAAGEVGISGSLGIGGAGATVSWAGTTSGSVTADGSGNYNTVEVLAPTGVYTITPVKNGYMFNPINRLETLAGNDVTGVNFTATKIPAGSGAGRFGYGYKFQF